MNLADFIVIALLAGTCFWAWRRSATMLAGGTLGVIAGFLAAGIAYRQLAFLAQSSAIRTVALIALLSGMIFLCADAAVILSRWLERRFWPKFRDNKAHRFIATGLGLGGGLIIITMLSVAFGNALPSAAQQQIRSAVILGTLIGRIPMPAAIADLSALRQPFSQPIVFSGREAIYNFDASILTNEYEELDAAAEKAKASVVSITTWGCGSVTNGSGFILGPRHVLTNAHVVAGGDRISFTVSNGKVAQADVVAFDPRLDVALLYVQSDLTVPPLAISTDDAVSGNIASHLGFSGQSPIMAGDVVVLEKLTANGYDIFGRAQVQRQIYALRGEVIPGNSGGPVIAADGRVLGIIIGHSTTENRTGYAVASSEFTDLAKKSPTLVANVGAGDCIAK